MRKVLIGVLVCGLTLGLAGVSLAAVDISTSGVIEFKVTGKSEGASGVFGAGDVLIDYNVVATSGPWKAVVSPEFDIGAEVLTECDAYIVYQGGAFTLTLDPTGISNAIFDIYVYGPGGVVDDELNMKGNPGLKISVPMEGFTFYAVANNKADEDDVVFNFGGGADFAVGPLSVGLKFNSDSMEDSPFYGTSYGAKVGYSAGSLSLTAEYGAWNPGQDTAWLHAWLHECDCDDGVEVKSGSGYFFKMVYTLPGGDSFTLQYKSSDKYLNGVGYGPSDHAYSQIKGVYSHKMAENVTLSFEVVSTDDGYGDEESVTSWAGKLSFAV
ncbi:hypothetical protein H5U35_04945 [Candidatus Aerophobetes bacterium]|nr:hypothetical protein [Candidatus Aerophobetes bacterium]